MKHTLVVILLVEILRGSMLDIKIEPVLIILAAGIVFLLIGDITIPFIASFIYLTGKLEKSRRFLSMINKIQRLF